MDHLKRHALIPHSHHGSVNRKSTQTLIIEMHDSLIEDLTKDTESALLVLDQSKAYDLVSHPILLQKFSILGFNRKAVNTMNSYLSNRKQYIELQGFQSQDLLVGQQSVTQGSTLSCAMYLMYILNLPYLFQEQTTTPEHQRKSNSENLKTFVDDILIHLKKNQHNTIDQAIHNTMSKVKLYTDANRLQLNCNKTKIMIISKDTTLKKEFQITIDNRLLRHSPQLKILGNLVTDDLTWTKHVQQIVIPGLKNRLRTIKLITKYLDQKFKINYINSIYRSKLLFALETWGGPKNHPS